MVLACLKDGLSPEGIESIDDSLNQSDYALHPLQTAGLLYADVIRKSAGVKKRDASRPAAPVPGLPELPIEEQKRREALEQGKAYRVPDWWRGERANYKIAQTMMKTIPKNIGPINK